MIGLRPIDPGGRPLDVLCLGAHSDDIEIGCGGTLLRLVASRPVRVRWVVLSASGDRRAEAEASAGRFLAGADEAEVVMHDFTDGLFPAERAEIKRVFATLAAARNPDLVFTHRERDLHQDHALVGALTRETFRDHALLEYEIAKYDGDLATPNLYVPLDDETSRQKVALLLEGFPSQRAKHWFDASTFEGLLRLRGIECAAPSGWAEGFHARKVVLEP